MKLLLLALSLSFVASLAWAQPIYKVVDEDGNVTYTDQNPADGAEPMELPELNVLDGREVESQMPAGSSDASEVEPLKLSIVSPQDEENIRGTGNSLSVTLESNIDLPASALIVVYLDGEAQEPTQSMSYSFDFIPRGQHTLRAELQTRSGRVLAESEPVTFFMRQASRINPPGS